MLLTRWQFSTESICSPQNVAFVPKVHLQTQLCYFLNKNPKALGFWQQISRIQMKEKNLFLENQDAKIFFCFLDLFKNLGKM